MSLLGMLQPIRICLRRSLGIENAAHPSVPLPDDKNFRNEPKLNLMFRNTTVVSHRLLIARGFTVLELEFQFDVRAFLDLGFEEV